MILVVGVAAAGPLEGQARLRDLLPVQHSVVLDPGAPVEGDVPVVNWVGDFGRISRFEIDGDYSRFLDGTLNLAARTGVAEAFYAAHADTYDFLIVFSTFDYDLGGAAAFHIGVRNDVEGIGLALFDQSDAFGSGGVLRGYIDMGPLDALESDPLDPDFESTLAILVHEIFHQWGAYVGYDQGEGVRSDLRQSDGVHWSFLLDSDASVLYGNDWRDNQDGTFTAHDALRVLSPLDLYLGGFYQAAETPPFVLLDSPGTDPDRPPEANATIAATARLVAVEEVLAVEGPRLPPAQEAPHALRAGFLVLQRPGEDLTEAQLLALENIRAGLLSRFVALTGGRGRMEIFPQPIEDGGGGPGGVDGGEIRQTPANVLDALAWLRVEQSNEGYWQDLPSTRVRDSAVVLPILTEIDPLFEPAAAAQAQAFLEQATPLVTDLVARRARVLTGEAAAQARAELVARQNPDGGWGADLGLESNPLDTALALAALLVGGPTGAIASGRVYLADRQLADGGWSMTSGGPSHVTSTVTSLAVLPADDTALSAAVDWLTTKQNPDGGFGDSPSTAHGTALALQALLDLEATAVLGTGLAEAQSYLTSRQDVQGSWEGSVYTTALVARTLQRLALPNWRVTAFSATPSDPIDGESVELTVAVLNDGNVAAPPSTVELFDGDPVTGGTLIAALDLPAMAAGESVGLTETWETLDSSGSHELVALADPEGLVAEVSEADNRQVLTIEVGPAPLGPDLAIGAGAMTVTPPFPDRLPTLLSLSTRVANLGQTATDDVVFALWRGEPQTGELLDTAVASVAARASIVVNFSAELTAPGTTRFSLVADASEAIEEADEDNNEGSAEVTTVPSVDLEILDSDVVVDSNSVYVGQDAEFTVTLRNRGTSDAPVAGLAYQVTDGVEVRNLPAPTVLIAAGQTIERTVLWRVDLGGDLTFTAAVDPSGSIPELDEANNLGAVALQALVPDQPNLTIGVGDLTADPQPALEGLPLTLAARVRNTGPSDIADVTVAFFDGDPAAGGSPIALPVSLPLVPAGGEALAELVWASVPDALDRTLVVQVDPSDSIPEVDEADNATFLEIEVLNLPDLAVAQGLVAVDPPQPTPGQTVSVTVTVQNLGQQDVADATVRVLEGDEATGMEVDLDQFVVVPGQGSVEAFFDWTLDATPTARTLTVVVDPSGDVVESNEANNVTTRAVGVQGGGLAVSAPIFSPNGDGILDSTTMGFGFEVARTVTVEVVDVERGLLVLRYSGPELTEVTQGEFTWDGLGDHGRVVRDTEYLLRLVEDGGAVLGDASVTVDTNLSSLISALGTESEDHSNLTCRPNPEDYVLPRREDWGYFVVRTRPTAEYPKGLYRSRLDGSDTERLVSEPWLTISQSIEQFVVSADGTKMAFQRLDEGDPATPNDDLSTLWVANSDGTGLYELVSNDPLLPLGRFWEIIGFSASLRTLLVAHEEHGLLEYRLDGPPTPMVREAPGLQYGPLSPDHRYLAVADPAAAVLRVLDIDGGEFYEVFASSSAPLTWSPDGSRLTVAQGRYLYVMTPQGAPEQTLELPELLDDLHPLVAADAQGAMWSSTTPELAAIAAYDDPTTVCFPQRVLFTVDLETGLATERARSEPGLPCHFGDGDSSEGPFGEEVTEYAIDQATRVVWDPADRTLVTSSLKVLNLDEDLEWRQLVLPGADHRLSPTGRYWLYRSSAEAVDPDHSCYNNPGHLIDSFAVRSFDNLAAQLTAIRPPSSDGIELSGTAADKHFRRHFLEWSDALAPTVWHPIGTPSTREVFDELLSTWVPPYPGVFTLRLTAEDEAGTLLRRVRRVVSSTSPDLTEVDVVPRLLSPNGDAMLDEAIVSYDVERPTVVSIRVTDSTGTVLRTIERTYPSGGVSDSVVWDGRDEAGLALSDGEYEVLVNKYRFPLEVDLTPPVLSGSTTLLRPPASGAGLPGELFVTFASIDVNALAFSVESGLGDPPVQWEMVPANCVPMAVGFQCSAIVGPEAFVGRSFRAVASDLAGNQNALTVEAAQGVVTTGFGAHTVDPDTGALSQLSTVGEERFEVLDGPVRFAVTDAVAGELIDLVAQYRACPCPLPGDPQTPWTDSLLGAVYEPGSSLPVAGLPEPYFEVVWPAEELENDLEYEVRLRALDAEFEEFVSDPIRLLQRPLERLLFGSIARAHAEWVPAAVRQALLSQGYDVDRVAVVWGRETFASELSDYRVTLHSEEDPDYAIPGELDLLLAVPDADDESELYFVMEDWVGCALYAGTLTAESPDGPVASPQSTLQLPCLAIDVSYPQEYVGECGAPPLTPERVVSIVPRSLDLAELSLLRIIDSAGTEAFRVEAPISDATYEWTVNTAELSEGRHAYVAELTNSEGDVHLRPDGISLVADRTPPEAAITFPQAGQRVCGQPWPAGLTVTLEGELVDQQGLDFQLEYGRGESPEEWFLAEVGPANLPPDGPPFEPLGRLQLGLDGEVERGTLVQDYSGPLSRSGSIANEAGLLTARLRAVDMGPQLVCEQVTFEFDGLVVGAQLTAAPRSFSPNGDSVLELASVSVTATTEPLTVDIDIYPGVMTGAGPVVQGPLVRALAVDLQVSGTEILEWDGHDDGGALVPDGNYLALAGWRDDCGNPLVQAVPIEVDTLAPTVDILSPTGGTPLPIVVAVFADIVDNNLQGWVLEYGMGTGPLEFAPIASGASVPVASPLAEWNTLGLEGEYTLRLRAFDPAGNMGSASVLLDFADRLSLVSYFEALPDPFSPNGDGRRETTALRFGLTEPAVVTLELTGPSTALLIDGAALPAGAHVEGWDGVNGAAGQAPDGVYLGRLTAALAADPLVTQTEEVYLTLDRQAPALDLVPADGEVVTSAGSIFGSITDPNLSAYTLVLDDVEVAAGDSERTDYAFASLLGQAEGEHGLVATAVDAAENESSTSRIFTLDDTVPEIELISPPSNAPLGGALDPHEVTGRVVDENLASWRLEVGEGAAPEAWLPLVNSTEPVDGLLLSWDVSAMPDGLHTLRLSAVDRAGNETLLARPVAIDNTAPEVSISEPQEGAWVTAPSQILGTAVDAYLTAYELAVAPGGGGAFSTLAEGSESVVGGVLGEWSALPSDGAYELRLTAADASGNEASTVVTLMVDTVPPAPPLGLVGELVAARDVELGWSPNVEPDLAGYHVYRDGVRVSTGLLAEPYFADLGLPEGTYEYRVSATDQAGLESEGSLPVTMTVDLTPPLTYFLDPEDLERVGGVVPIEGTAYSPDDFAAWRVLAVSPVGGAALLASGEAPVEADLLAAWNTGGLGDEEEFLLRLEADDVHGNTGAFEIRVTIDNLPPAAPTGLTATAVDDDVTLAWADNSDDDLFGYLLFRDDVLVNGDAGVSDYRPYALQGTTYEDLDLPDGTFEYMVYAIDQAANLSPPSPPDSVTLDNRPPSVEIYQPSDGAEIEGSLTLRADCPDDDVASVLFQYRAAGTTPWIDLGEPVVSRPFDILFDPEAQAPPLPFDTYEVRAVGTDENGNVDPSPTAVSVIYGDFTPPAVPTGVSTTVTADAVALSWDASSAPDFEGFNVYRATDGGSEQLLNPAPLASPSYDDANLAEGLHSYRVSAVDVSANESEPSGSVPALVYLPDLDRPWTPTGDAAITLVGRAAGGATVSGEVTNGGTELLPPVEAGPEGDFSLPVPLASGGNQIVVHAVDAGGNRSKDATVSVVRGTAPAPPTGLTAQVTGFDVDLVWDAAPEPQVVGYRTYRDGAPAQADRTIEGLVATASVEQSAATNAVDGDPGTSWALGLNAGPHWLEVAFPEGRQLAGLNVNWSLYATSYSIEVWSGSDWLTAFMGEDDETETFLLPAAYRTDRLRLTVDAEYGYSVSIYEVEPIEQPTVGVPAYAETVADGTYEYWVTAIDSLGFESGPSAAVGVEVGDVTPPGPVTLSASLVNGWDVQLAWTESTAGDLTAYAIYRDGELIASVLDLDSRTHLDTDLANGVYQYLVRAVDASGNESSDSNIEQVTVEVEPPEAPTDLLAADSAGAIDLSWSPPPGDPPTDYVLRRALVSGGPYELVAITTEPSARDSAVDLEVEYFYVVAARDLAGNESVPSNEASARVPVAAPKLHYPGFPGREAVVQSALVEVRGTASPGAEVTLYRGVEPVDTTTSRPSDLEEPMDVEEEPPVQALLSPDGRLLFARDPFSAALYDFATGTTDELPDEPSTVVWTHDASGLLYLVGAGTVRRFDVASGLKTDLLQIDSAVALAASAFDDTWLVLGELSGAAGVYHFDGGATTFVAALPPSEVEADTLSWSPDGRWLAYLRSGAAPGLELLDLDNGTSRTVAGPSASSPTWSRDSSRLAFDATDGGGAAQVWIYDLALEASEMLTSDGGDAPAWSADGAALALRTGGALVLLDVASGESRDIAPCAAECRAQWTRSGHLLQFTEAEAPVEAPVRWTLAGQFALDGVALDVGVNELSASQTLAGVTSAMSSAMRLVRAGDLPDIELLASGLSLLPAVPEVGETVDVSATVSNIGSVASPATDLLMVVTGPEGFYLPLDPLTLPAIAPGASETLTGSVVAGWPHGVYSLRAQADPFFAVPETEEENNQAERLFALVEEEGDVVLSVGTDSSIYGADSEVQVSAVAIASVDASDVVLTIDIEDAAGELVERLEETTINLEAGVPLELHAQWNTGGTFAGEYRAVVRLAMASGPLANGGSEFTIAPVWELELSVASELPAYPVGLPVEIEAQATYVVGNVVLSGLEAVHELSGPDASPIESWTFELGDLLPGADLTLPVVWESAEADPGNYGLRFSVRDESGVLAEASSEFVLGSSGGGLEGSVAARPSPAPIAEEVLVEYSLSQADSEPLETLPIWLRFVDPETAGIVAERGLVVSVPAGGSVAGEESFDTEPLGVGDILLVLVVELAEGEGGPDEVVLATALLSVADLTPPQVSVVEPVEGGFLGLPAGALIEALDLHTQVAQVEVSLDAGVWQVAAPYDPSAGLYRSDLGDLAEGGHSLSARAIDTAGNSATTEPIEFTLDLTAPEIIVSGVEAGGVYGSAVTPIVQIVEANPASEAILLNGEPFVSGTSIATPGAYRLSVAAEDAAGNRSDASLDFTLLPPSGGLSFVVNSSNDANDGLCDAAHCSLREAILAANQDPGMTRIAFDIAGLEPAQIRPMTALPPVETATEIDGLTQPGSGCTPRSLIVELRGDRLLGGADGLTLLADGSSVRGLAVTGFSGSGLVLGGEAITVTCMHLGVDRQGVPAGNAAHGIQIANGSASGEIGGLETGVSETGACEADCNWIAFNGGHGLAFAAGAGPGTGVLGNRIANNDGLAIDLATDGLTENDPLDVDNGPNGLQNYPEILSIQSGTPSTVNIALESEPSSDFVLEVYANQVANGDSGGNPQEPPAGELETLVGRAWVTTGADGLALAAMEVSTELADRFVTATATDLATGSTSEASLASNQMALPELRATKVDLVAIDGDDDGVASPGDILRYTIDIANVGEGVASAVRFDDLVPQHTMVVPGSVTASQGSVEGEDPVVVALATLAAGSSASVSFDVAVIDPLPAGVVAVVNQGTVSASEMAELTLTDDPDVGGEEDPTATALVAAPLLAPAAFGVSDSPAGDADGLAQPGEVLTYQISVVNAGDAGAQDVRILDLLPPTLALDLASLQVTLGGGAAGVANATAGNTLDVSVSSMPGRGGSVALSYQAMLGETVPAGLEVLGRTAQVESALVEPFETEVAEIVVDARPALALTKSDDDAIAEPEEPVIYELELVNEGLQDASNVELEEAVPIGSLFDATRSDPRWSCAHGAPEGSICTLAEGLLAAGQSRSYGFAVEVVPPPALPEFLINVASASDDGAGTGGVPVEVEVTESTPVDNLMPPVILTLDSVPGSGGGALAECEETDVAVTGFEVQFSEAMDPASVTSLASWLVVAAGPDRDLSTILCDGVAGDDSMVAVASVIYDPGQVTALVDLESELSDSPYRLFACAAGGLTDVTGTELDGDGDGVEGDDFRRTFRVARENALANGSLDCGLEDWILVEAGGSAIEHDGRVDVDDAVISGAARFVNLAGNVELAMGQCVATSAGSVHLFGGFARLEPGSPEVELLRACEFFDGEECSGSALPVQAFFQTLGSPGAWVGFESEIVSPPAASSALCQATLRSVAAAPFEAHLDSLYLRALVSTLIFQDGFESGDTSAWSATVP